MAFPVIVFDRDLGTDGDTASGAGPLAAVTGTKARNASSSARIGFFETSAPDLSLVAVDGSHALYLATASGRRLFKISARKTTAQSVTGSINSGSSSLTSTDTTGWTDGDVISVATAGPSGGPLYATVTVTGATTATLSTTASATVSGVAVANPAQVTVHTAPSLSSDTAWAIGGRRNEPMSATFLPGDLLAGWGVRFIASETNLQFAFTSAWTLTVSGDTTSGPITIDGTLSSSGRRPRVGGTSSVSPFTVRASKIRILDINGDGVSSVVLVDSASTSDLYCRGLMSSDSTYGVRLTSAATGSRFRFEQCNLAGAATAPFSIEGAVSGVSIEGCQSPHTVFGGGAKFLTMRHNLFSGPIGAGSQTAVLIDTASAAVGVIFENNSIQSCLEGLRFKDLNGAQGAVIRNNDFGLNGTALKCDVSGADLAVAFNDHNNYWGNTTNRSNFSAGANDLAVDPEFWLDSPSSLADLRPGLALRGQGWPETVGVVDLGAVKETSTSIDVGVAQAREAVSGSVLGRIVSVTDSGTTVDVGVEVVNGIEATARIFVSAERSLAPADTKLDRAAFKKAVEVFLRDGAAASLLGMEVRA